MITRTLVLAMVLAITLAVATLVLADHGAGPPEIDIGTATPIEGYPDYEIAAKGFLVHGGDVIVGNCGSSRPFAFPSKSDREEAAHACENADASALLAETGGLPVILVPIALLALGGLLIRKSVAG